MKSALREIGGHLADVAWVAVRSFAGTIFIATLAGGVLAGASYYFVRDLPWFYGVTAVAIALIESVVIGFVLGAKRAAIMAMMHGFDVLRLGRSLVRMVFERMLGVTKGDESGKQDERIVRELERLPLAQADELLAGAVRDVTGEAEQGGWLRRKIRTRLLGAVEKYTLARFREEGAAHSCVDLSKIQEELERTIDDVLIQKIRGSLRIWTTLLIIGLPCLVAVQTWIIIIVHSKS